jgi:hypothetical protein
MSQELRQAFRKIACEHFEKQAKEDKKTDDKKSQGKEVKRKKWALAPKTYKRRKLSKGEILKYLLGYTGAGAVLGAGTGAAIGGLKAKPMITGGAIGGTAGLGLGTLAMNAAAKAPQDNSDATTEPFDLPNFIGNRSWLTGWLRDLGIGGAFAATELPSVQRTMSKATKPIKNLSAKVFSRGTTSKVTPKVSGGKKRPLRGGRGPKAKFSRGGGVPSTTIGKKGPGFFSNHPKTTKGLKAGGKFGVGVLLSFLADLGINKLESNAATYLPEEK